MEGLQVIIIICLLGVAALIGLSAIVALLDSYTKGKTDNSALTLLVAVIINVMLDFLLYHLCYLMSNTAPFLIWLLLVFTVGTFSLSKLWNHPVNTTKKKSQKVKIKLKKIESKYQEEKQDNKTNKFPIEIVVFIIIIIIISVLTNTGGKIENTQKSADFLVIEKMEQGGEITVDDLAVFNDINKNYYPYGTPLEIAIKHNVNPAIVKAIVEKGGNVNFRYRYSQDNLDEGDTILMLAAINTKYPEVIDILIKAGLSINSKNEKGETVIQKACKYAQHSEVLDRLLKGASKKELQNCFSLAAKNNKNVEITNLLLSKGVNVNSDSALVDAISAQHTDVALLLIEKGANVNLCQTVSDKSFKCPLYAVLDPRQHIKTEEGAILVEKLLQHGANPNKICANLNECKFSINLAIDSGYRIEVIMDLLKHGAIVNEKNKKEGYATPLLKALQKRRGINLIKLLIEYGADVNYIYDSRSTMSWGSVLSMSDTDLEKAVFRDYERKDALEYAIDQRNVDLVNLLIEKGAKVKGFHIAGAKKIPEIYNSPLYGKMLDKQEKKP